MTYLSETFLDKYPNNPEMWDNNIFGFSVYKRTYSRWLEDKQRREHWKETVQRTVEYSMSLYQGPATKEQLQKEAEDLFDYVFNLKLFPAGRTLWIGGTEAVKKYPLANFNCTFKVIDSLKSFSEVFYVLLVGAGAGFRVLFEDVTKLPQFNVDVALAHKPYHQKEKSQRIEQTQVYREDDSVYIVVGDSKDGWVSALEEYLKAMTDPAVESIVINYDSVRPAGEPLKTFGGYASGHGSLRSMFKQLHKVIRSGDRVITPLQAMELCNIIAQAVVVGGVRRSSQIALFDLENDAIRNAKVDLYTDPDKSDKLYRALSNNSIFFEDRPSKETLREIFDSIQKNYEPGLINAAAARKRRPNYKGTNPCSEILLDDRGTCNLSEVNLRAFVNPDGSFDVINLLRAVELNTRIGLRQTNVTLELPEWDAVQKRDRLLGVSLTGIMDAYDASNLSRAEFIELLELCADHANQEADKYAYEMRVPRPLLVTTIKPSGTISQLPTVSSGVHRSFAPYFIRRMRITATDPFARVLYDLGLPTYPDGVFAEKFDSLSPLAKQEQLQKANTWVIEFPVKTSAKIRAAEESATDQFQRYLDFQEYYTDHNTSNTIQFSPDEVNDLVDMIYDNWDKYIGVSFMVKDTNHYPLMPYEEISEVEYNNRAEKIQHITPSEITELLNEYERENMASELLDADCVGGACPVR